MDCNKDKAIRAKEVAVKKFTRRDFSGAKKFALEAQTLYPRLEGISQMVTTLDVYMSAENRVAGETDLYGILGVHPFSDSETIKKRYAYLVCQLHPDGALLLVTEAVNVLSDKAKRSAYDKMLRTKIAASDRTVDHKVPESEVPVVVRTGKRTPRKPRIGFTQREVNSLVPPRVNENGKHPDPTSSHGKSQNGGSHKASPKCDKFWTLCPVCKMQYECMRVYLNKCLSCPKCKRAFIAVEIPIPSNVPQRRPFEQPQEAGDCSAPAPHAQATDKRQMTEECLKTELETDVRVNIVRILLK